MKDYSEITEALSQLVGDEVVGFFERKLATSGQVVRVFTPVYKNQTKPEGFVN